MDLTKIKEAAERYAANHVGAQIMGKGSAEIEARKLALAVPALIAEIERRGALLASLCQAGDRAMELLDASDVGPRDRVTIALARAIEAATS